MSFRSSLGVHDEWFCAGNCRSLTWVGGGSGGVGGAGALRPGLQGALGQVSKANWSVWSWSERQQEGLGRLQIKTKGA